MASKNNQRAANEKGIRKQILKTMQVNENELVKHTWTRSTNIITQNYQVSSKIIQSKLIKT